MFTTSEFAVGILDNALPAPLFDRLLQAVRDVGTERLSNNGSYTTTFWYARGMEPRNIAEKVIVELDKEVALGPECIGFEWWLGRLKYGKELGMHFDCDLALKRKTGESVHPLLSSVLYLNKFRSAPTVVLDQVLSEDGNSRIPEEAEYGKSVSAKPNRYIIFDGKLRHGVVHDPEAPKPARVMRDGEDCLDLRLTFLVNYWHRRPLEPICQDYDGTIYPALREATLACK